MTTDPRTPPCLADDDVAPVAARVAEADAMLGMYAESLRQDLIRDPEVALMKARARLGWVGANEVRDLLTAALLRIADPKD